MIVQQMKLLQPEYLVYLWEFSSCQNPNKPGFDAEANNSLVSRNIAFVNQIIGSDTIHPNRVSHLGLKSSL